MTKLTEKATESSTYIITVAFKDADGTPVTPTTCLWTLSDTKGTVLNLRDRVSVTPTGTSYDFVLSGDDLLYAVGLSKGTRVFTVEGTYTSSYGAGLPYRSEVAFEILNTVIDAE